jgi:hypothetical protein
MYQSNEVLIKYTPRVHGGVNMKTLEVISKYAAIDEMNEVASRGGRVNLLISLIDEGSGKVRKLEGISPKEFTRVFGGQGLTPEAVSNHFSNKVGLSEGSIEPKVKPEYIKAKDLIVGGIYNGGRYSLGILFLGRVRVIKQRGYIDSEEVGWGYAYISSGSNPLTTTIREFFIDESPIIEVTKNRRKLLKGSMSDKILKLEYSFFIEKNRTVEFLDYKGE